MKNQRSFLCTTTVMDSDRVVSNPRPEWSLMKNHRSFLCKTKVVATRLALWVLAMAVLTATLVATAATPPATSAVETRQVKLDALAFRQAQWLAANTAPPAAAEMWALHLDATATRLAPITTARSTPTEAQEMRAIKLDAAANRLAQMMAARTKPAEAPEMLSLNRRGRTLPPHRCTCDPFPKNVLAAAGLDQSVAVDRA